MCNMHIKITPRANPFVLSCFESPLSKIAPSWLSWPDHPIDKTPFISGDYS